MRLEKELDSFSSFYWSKLFSSHLMFLIVAKVYHLYQQHLSFADIYPHSFALRSTTQPFQASLYMRSIPTLERANLACSPVVLVLLWVYTSG